MLLILLIILLVLALGGGVYGGTRDWGYAGWSPLGIIVVVIILLWVFGAIHP